jgi:hypothetical protein
MEVGRRRRVRGQRPVEVGCTPMADRPWQLVNHLSVYLSHRYAKRVEQESGTDISRLVATNQPCHLISFIAISVICAEFIAVTELYILFSTTFRLVSGSSQQPLRLLC